MRYIVTDGDGGGSGNHDATVTVTVANDAPVLDNSGAMALGTISMGQTNNGGTLVADLLQPALRVDDSVLGVLNPL